MKLKSAINRENPMGFFFIREDGTITNEPWVVDKIFPVTRKRADGKSDTIHHIRVSRVGRGDIVDEYALGDFMESRLVRKAVPGQKLTPEKGFAIIEE